MPSTDLAPTSRQTNSVYLPACGPSETPESLGNSDHAPRSLVRITQTPRSMFGVSEKCREGRQEDRMLWLKSGFVLQMQMT